ncbi:hypothetical protein DXG01_001645 [Tephrocybe rancida]|nr:hypothetical protein DXG01_001645 [Tephrocybe rancida]
MFFSPYTSLFFVIGALASPYQFNGLSVELSGPPPTVNSVDHLQFTATVTNHGTTDMKILKYATILDDVLPTKSFTISKGNVAVPFTGAKLFLSFTALDDSAFTVIPAGESVVVFHDIVSLFDLSSFGTGRFTFDPIVDFRAMPASQPFVGGVTRLHAVNAVNIRSNNMVITVTQDTARREHTELDKRAVDVCSSATQKAFVDSSYAEAKDLATGAINYVKANGTDLLYLSYWGNTSTSDIINVYGAVAGENSTFRTMSCTDNFSVCSSGVIAYTVTATTNVYYCPLFFTEKPTNALCNGTTVASRNIRGGTTLHEAGLNLPI